ncbi:RNA polymerase sigma factor [Bombilactobacillus bombi]|uniref:RNA polymerase sigma factor n=1 Tax=Bombilactobacillus bombi TaxID=1303590 RepID=UPI0015E5F7EE|nr:sigma-70 family RNA polymerase sigma factor [Bombilactobacillus bombi]MBA1433867.1 sigma-70 family RNA polymerase sigma factor [Bombilactobacillus bombi]
MKLDGYEELIKEMLLELRNYLISQGAKPQVAEDVIQDVFVKVLEMELILPPEQLRPYMYRMVQTKYIDTYRRQRHWQQLLEKYLIPEYQQLTPAEVSPREVQLGQALEQLSITNRQLLRWRYLDKKSITQIAVQLQIPQAAVKMRLYRLRHKLKKIMGDEINE